MPRLGRITWTTTTLRSRSGTRAQGACQPKVAKLVTNELLHDYVQDRLSGRLTTQDGVRVGPARKEAGRPEPPTSEPL